MNKKKFTQESELCNRDISSTGRLKTFKATNTDTHMGGLNHGNVVGAVTNG
jgi:hypothetical protein